MARNRDIVQEFTALQKQLVTERDEIQKRLNALNRALGEASSTSSSTRQAAPAQAVAVSPSGDASKMGMREVIQQVTAARPMSVREIVDAMQSFGYRFKSKNPYNSVGAYLYGKEGKKYFKRGDAGFSATRSSASSAANGGAPRKRNMSAAGRRRIAEAARARWAKHRAAKGK